MGFRALLLGISHRPAVGGFNWAAALIWKARQQLLQRDEDGSFWALGVGSVLAATYATPCRTKAEQEAAEKEHMDPVNYRDDFVLL